MVTVGQSFVVTVDWLGYVPGTIVVRVTEIISGGGHGQDVIVTEATGVSFPTKKTWGERRKYVVDGQEVRFPPDMLTTPVPPHDPTVS